MKKAKKIDSQIIVYDVPPTKWDGVNILSEEDYIKLGFKDFIEPELITGQFYGDIYEDILTDTYTLEVVEHPLLTSTQKLGKKIQNPITKIFTYTVIDKSLEDITLEHNNLLRILNISKSVLISKLEKDTNEFIKTLIGEKSNEYEIAEKEAIAYKEAGYPENNVPLSIKSDAIANGHSNTVACDLILTMANNWRTTQSSLRANRLLAKANAKKALTIDELNSIVSTWNEFLIFITN